MDLNRDNRSHSPHSNDFVFVLSACLVIIEVLGLLCNGIILMVYYKYSRLRTATNLFILNLAVCNLLLATLQLLLSTPSYFNKKWLYGYDGCIAYGFAHQYLITVAVVTLAVIAFDRFCVITRPVRKLQTFVVTKPRARLFILITHIYSFVFTFPLLVGWNKLIPDIHYETGCYIQYSNRESSPMAYTITSTVFTCILPLVITTLCYAKIYKSVRNSAQKSTLHKSTIKDLPSSVRKRSLYHTRTARMIAIVMFFFLLTWLPTKVTGLLATFGCPVPSLAVYVSVFLTKSCVMYNAVVYVFMNHRFRAAFLHLTFICREDSRLRFTSVTNASVRFADILPSVADNCENPRAQMRKTLSKVNFVPEEEISSNSAARCVSTLDFEGLEILETCEDSAETLQEISGDYTLGAKSVESSRNGSFLNGGLQEDDYGETEKGGELTTTVGSDPPLANNGVPPTGNNMPTYELSSTGQKLHNFSYGFNNQGLQQSHEFTDVENREYLELNINSLGNT